MLVIVSQSVVSPGFILSTTIYAPFYLTFLVVFGDMILDLILRAFPFYQQLYKPVISQGTTIDRMFDEGYQNYLDIPVWSTIYPLFRWVF